VPGSRQKARAPYEFGCKVSIASPVTAPKGRQFVLDAKALHGNPYDGHTLGPVIADLEKLTGVTVRRIHGDKGYRGHNYPNRFKVCISGQVRRVTKAIRREMRRAPPSNPSSATSRRITAGPQLSHRPRPILQLARKVLDNSISMHP